MSSDGDQHFMHEDDIVMHMDDDDEEDDEDCIDPEDLDEDDDEDDDDDEEDDDEAMLDEDDPEGRRAGNSSGAVPTNRHRPHAALAAAPAAASAPSSSTSAPEAAASAAPVALEEGSAIARRRLIQEVMRNPQLSEQEKRMQIQNIMSGGRTCVAVPPAPAIPQPEANAACVHYERNCNIVSPCCNRVFGCRICHDELSSCRQPLNRFMIQEVVCKNCHTRQRAS